MTSPVVFRTIREQIANRLRHEVLSGQLVAGEALRETKLAQRFGVSRGPIRDALLQLTQEGLLVSQPNCGVKVGGASSDAIRTLLVELRKQIERYALEQIFDSITEDDLQGWEATLAQLKAACERGDMADIVAHDMAFHRSMIERTGEPDLLAVWLPMIVRIRLLYSRHENLMQIYDEHAPILHALRSRNLPAAVAALEGNIW